MAEKIILEFRLTKELWRQFFDAHYGCEKSIKFHYLWGVICLVIGTAGFGGFYDSLLIASLLLFTGFYGIFAKHLLIFKSLGAAGKHPFYGKELTVAASGEEISVRSENSGYSQPWGNFVGYRKLDPGFLLYHDKKAFFFIPSASMTAGQIRSIIGFLDAAEVPKLS